MKQHLFYVIVEKSLLVREDVETDLVLGELALTVEKHVEPPLEEESQAEAW